MRLDRPSLKLKKKTVDEQGVLNQLLKMTHQPFVATFHQTAFSLGEILVRVYRALGQGTTATQSISAVTNKMYVCAIW